MDYCQWETFEASCPSSNQVIMVMSARYGRMKFGRCMREDHGSVGCAADVRSYVAGQCSGRRHCRLNIPDAALHSVHPCPKELMPYLEASYSCVTGNDCYQRPVGYSFCSIMLHVNSLPYRRTIISYNTRASLLICLRSSSIF